MKSINLTMKIMMANLPNLILRLAHGRAYSFWFTSFITSSSSLRVMLPPLIRPAMMALSSRLRLVNSRSWSTTATWSMSGGGYREKVNKQKSLTGPGGRHYQNTSMVGLDSETLSHHFGLQPLVVIMIFSTAFVGAFCFYKVYTANWAKVRASSSSALRYGKGPWAI